LRNDNVPNRLRPNAIGSATPKALTLECCRGDLDVFGITGGLLFEL